MERDQMLELVELARWWKAVDRQRRGAAVRPVGIRKGWIKA